MDSQPLLPGPNALQDHPAFLRASHSPWRFIPQNVLVLIRGLILAYLIAAGILIADYLLNEDSDLSNWRHIFNFAVDVFIMTFIYQLITFGWTFTHLYYPQRNNISSGFEGLLVNALSLPRNMANLRTQFYFTLFYALTVVFAFMNSAIYWFIIRSNGDIPDPVPPEASGTAMIENSFWDIEADRTVTLTAPPFDDLFNEGSFRAFVILNLYGITTVIMLIEILWLNSIRRPYTIGPYIFAVMFFSAVYLGWAALGHLLTDYYAFFFLDADEVGSDEAVTAYCILFVALSPLGYVLFQGFTAIRDNLTRSLSEARAIAAAQEALDD